MSEKPWDDDEIIYFPVKTENGSGATATCIVLPQLQINKGPFLSWLKTMYRPGKTYSISREVKICYDAYVMDERGPPTLVRSQTKNGVKFEYAIDGGIVTLVFASRYDTEEARRWFESRAYVGEAERLEKEVE